MWNLCLSEKTQTCMIIGQTRIDTINRIANVIVCFIGDMFVSFNG